MAAPPIGFRPPLALPLQEEDGLPPELEMELVVFCKTISQLAVRTLFPLATFFMVTWVLPIAFHAVVLPAAAVGLAFLSAFFFQPENFYCPVAIKPRERLLAPLPEPGPLLQALPPPAPPPPDAPRGILNGGNNCWLITALQLIASDRGIRRWVTNPLPPLPEPDLMVAMIHRSLQQFFEAYDLAVQQNLPVIGNPIVVRQALGLQNPAVGGYHQADPHEGINGILNEIPQEEKIRINVRHHYSIAGLPPIADHPNGITEVEEDSGSLELAIQGAQPNLQEMIQLHCNEVIRPGDDPGVEFKGVDGIVHRYRHTLIERQFLQAPPTLRITLKRFGFQRPPKSWLSKIPYVLNLFPRLGGYILKNDSSVQIPLDLDVKQADGAMQRYRLKSFNCHVGATPHSGHYTAYSRRDEKWFLQNDAFVAPADQNEVERVLASGQPYMVWYEKI